MRPTYRLAAGRLKERGVERCRESAVGLRPGVDYTRTLDASDAADVRLIGELRPIVAELLGRVPVAEAAFYDRTAM
jgi:hypothetical protein